MGVGGLLAWGRSAIGGILLLFGLDLSSPPYPSPADFALLFFLEQNGFILNEETYLFYVAVALTVGLLILIGGMTLLGWSFKKLRKVIEDNWHKSQTTFGIFLLFLAVLIGGRIFGMFSVVGTSEITTGGTITFVELMVNVFVATVASVMASFLMAGAGLKRFVK